MSDYYVGEIRMFAGGYAPQDFVLCYGQTLPINQSQALYSLLGTKYGGDGVTTFGVPNLCGRAVVGRGQGTNLSNYALGQTFGSAQVGLSTAQMPAHTHLMLARTDGGTSTSPQGKAFAAGASGYKEYSNPTTDTTTVLRTLAADVVSAGAGQPHANVMPSTGITFIIAVNGLYPTFG